MLTFWPPIDASPSEMLLMRCGYAYLLYRCLKRRPRYNTQPNPTGLARFINFTVLAKPNVHRRLTLLVWVGLCFYVAGIGMPAVTLCLCLYVTARESLDNSQGAIEHAWNAVALVLLVQAALYGFEAFNTVFRPTFRFANGVTYDQVAFFCSQQAIVAVYFTAALSKLLNSRGTWIGRAPRVVLQIRKTSRQSYYTRLDSSHLDRSDRVATQVLQHPNLTRILLASGLIVELISPLFLYNRIANLTGGAFLILFHLVNDRYMRLPFKEQRFLVAIFFLQIPFALVTLGRLLGIPW